MDILTFMLRQSIGIYYKDFDWASRLFNRIMEYYPQEYFAERGIKKNKNNLRIEFKDGSVIRFVYANESSRGYSFSKIIMQPGIDEEIIRDIICPTLKDQNRGIMIFKNENDICFYKR